MKTRNVLPVAIAALLWGATAMAQQAEPLPPGDPASGEKVFNQCKACHTIEQGGANRVGPNLHGVVGRKAGLVEGFNYSPAIKAANITWDEASLAAYLADPKGFIPGNKMAFAGLKQPQQRADVIAFLKKNSEGGSGSSAVEPQGSGSSDNSATSGAAGAAGGGAGTQPNQTVEPGGTAASGSITTSPNITTPSGQ
ncbi:MAG TPA: cytochrome c family protein [Azospirillaceae bacterium]|nr:cytochrome c family protein [Azospirillaceae bacterium]